MSDDFDDTLTDEQYEELMLGCLDDSNFLSELMSEEEEAQQLRELLRTKDEELYQLLTEVQRACQRMFNHCIDTLQERKILVRAEDVEIDKRELN